MTETPGPPAQDSPPAQDHGRAGRNLPAAIGIGVGLGAYVVLSLIFYKPAFVLLVAVALALASIELHQALAKEDMHCRDRADRRWQGGDLHRLLPGRGARRSSPPPACCWPRWP